MANREVYKVDKVTGEVLAVYPTAADAADSEGMSRSTICGHLNRRSLSRGRACYRYADNYDANEVFRGRANRPVAVFCDGELVKVYDSFSEATKAYNVCNQAVVRAAKLKSKMLWEYDVRVLPRMGLIKTRKAE